MHGTGELPGIDGFLYRDPGQALGCQKITLDAKRLKIRCLTFLAAGTLPVVGDVAVLLHFSGDTAASGQAYCAQFGGTDLRNDGRVLKRIQSLPPATCLSF